MIAALRAFVFAVIVAGLVSAPSIARAQLTQDDDADTGTAKELSMPDGPSGEVVFLRAMTDKSTAYVGEQVTFSVYLYYRVKYEMNERHDPKLADFLRYPLLLDPSSTTPVFTTVAGERYGARLVERIALVPLKAGKLSTGSMAARFKGRDIGARVLKTSNEVTIDVLEPPKEGRPEGYVLGDVGAYTLSASVRPREVAQGGSVAVTIKIDGTGHVPTAVRLPVLDGVKWLTPTRKDNVSAPGSKISGSRSLEYIVRFEKAGTFDLGAAELPYFDPGSKKYEIAKAPLGKIEVAPRAGAGPGAAPVPGGPDDPLAKLPGVRRDPAFYRPVAARDVPFSAFLAGVAVPPVLALLVMALARLRASLLARRAREDTVLKTKLKSAWKEAAKADKANDPRSVAAAIERAVHAALEAKTGLKTRAYRMDELGTVVESAGVEASVAKEAKEVLSQCESLRFMPTVDEEAFDGLRARARALTKRLEA